MTEGSSDAQAFRNFVTALGNPVFQGRSYRNDGSFVDKSKIDLKRNHRYTLD
ncbi:hypothetical protein ACF3MZ_14735 [Paenibacillaceae bacterium WGS1546]|uniref:hypothetical protein n=1 Tax=Cohnella sp. WGS1546 TaxID=3366810 RepID=UPI00372D82EC